MFRLSKPLFRLSHSPPILLPLTPFSSRSDRIQKKIEIENAIDSTHRLDTIAEQETEKDKIDLFLKERRKEIEEVVKEKEVPLQAMISAISFRLESVKILDGWEGERRKGVGGGGMKEKGKGKREKRKKR